MHGRGDLLRIDLSSEKISREPIPTEIHRRFLGGEGINAWLLWQHFLRVDPKIDPLSQDNVLIVGVGPLASTGLGAGSKTKFTYKSPAYNLFGDTSVGGGFGSQLRWAGYDHIVITGKARHPVYIWINNDSVEIRNAGHLWGKHVSIADELIKDELGDDEIEAACIGQAGENLVRFASIMVSSHRAGGRGGGGCVFGSKNLKAIAARGTKGLSISDPNGLMDVMKEFRVYKERDPGSGLHRVYGTLSVLRMTHLSGFLAYRNAQGEVVPAQKMDQIDHNWYVDNMGVRPAACSPGCAYACGGMYHLKGNESPGAGRHAGEWGSKPEFGSANPFATGCDIPDMPEVCHLNRMCNEYGMDVMEVGMSISFLMELWERGIISGKDTEEWFGEPLSLAWGNYEAVERVIDSIALRKNELGNILSGGVYKAALRIQELKNIPVLQYAMYGKGGATHEAQGRFPSTGLCIAVASIGAHHTKGMGISAALSEEYLGTPGGGTPDASLWQGGPGGRREYNCELKGAGQALSEYFQAISNCLGVCQFLCTQRTQRELPLNLLIKALSATSGIRLTPEEALTAAERVVNIQKAFNSRLGLRREDDLVCNRWMNEPLQEGLAKGLKLADFLDPMKDGYYGHHKWDKRTSLQTAKKLAELGMQDVADVLAREGALIVDAGQ